MAGLNAAQRASGAEPDRVLRRDEAYAGVMLDDLTLQGVSEPYRMLTARSEYRLRLRADNAGLRLSQKGLAWGCIGRERAAAFSAFANAVAEALARARAEGATPAVFRAAGAPVNLDGRWRSVLDVLALPAMRPEVIEAMFPWLRDLAPRVREQVEAEGLYGPYLERQDAELQMLSREEALAIPDGIDFAAIAGLSREMQVRLAKARPATLGGATRLAGITPAAIAALAVHLRRA
jgi:tRNA uridine 5-carboxymethylaminomethyl modification enzyme